jgi:hypothetical protein
LAPAEGYNHGGHDIVFYVQVEQKDDEIWYRKSKRTYIKITPNPTPSQAQNVHDENIFKQEFA